MLGGIDCVVRALVPLKGDLGMPQLQNGHRGRHKMPARKSRKNFTKHATHPNGKNFVSGVMRGGIRF